MPNFVYSQIKDLKHITYRPEFLLCDLSHDAGVGLGVVLQQQQNLGPSPPQKAAYLFLMLLHSMGSTGSGTHITAFGSKIMHLKLILGHFGFLNV